TPVTVAFGNVTVAGDLSAITTGSDHPNISTSGILATKSVNRYWTLTNSGISFNNYGATFTFVGADVDGSAATGSFIISKRDAGVWTLPTVGTRLSTSTQATGMTAFSDFQLGEPSVLDHFLVEAAGGGNIGAQTAGSSFAIKITALDASNNTVLTF